jgi:SNF2-related domain/Helicase conserved C-terminal domain
MTCRFELTVSPAATELCLIDTGGPVPVDRWPVEAPPMLRAGVDLAQRLEAAGSAASADATLLIEHAAVAGLSVREASLLGLPAAAEAVATIITKGIITQPDFEVTLRWQRPTGQAIVGARRTGAWLAIGDQWRRLPDPLFSLAEAVDAIGDAGAETSARLTALARLVELLPEAKKGGGAQATGMLGSITIHLADAFSLDLDGDNENARLVPVLHRAGGDPAEPLLPEPLHHAFAHRQFNGFHDARPVYALGNGNFLVLSPPLRRALSVVRRIQSAAPATRRALFANPRLFLREALGDENETLIEGIFHDTPAYSERVIGLGLWRPRVVPWVQVGSTDWFGGADGAEAPQAPQRAGLLVGDSRIELNPGEADDLRIRVERAIGTGNPRVELGRPDGPMTIPATHETLAALARLEAARSRPATGEVRQPRAPAEVLLIHPNEDTLAVEALVASRPSPEPGIPAALTTPLKEHQREGLEWLQKAWMDGLPGVLLADDMGLGKTLQGLGLLLWLRQGMEAGIVPREPFLIVTPTGLLANWQKEHDDHLAPPGLGRCLPAFGAGLRALRAGDVNGRPTLDVSALRAADWVLTTYETLRDHDRDFGQVRFAAALFDEAQKIKTPGIRLTDAAKGVNAGFRIALTGTPVENRLSDLWCIIDAANPGYLAELKSFSRTYEQDQNPDRLTQLRKTLDQPIGGRQPVMLRRLRRDRLPDLPPLHEHIDERAMPPVQAAAYAEAIAQARAGRRGDVLAALQRLRAVSLHPKPDDADDDEASIAASGRFVGAFSALDEIAAARERALLFVDDLAIQARLTGIIQRRYRLSTAPMVINGSVAGKSRQSRVDRFQAAEAGFDVMILSPRAGGVGLTLTRANHVIHLSRWWNPAVEDQCNGRALRIGQTRPVTVHIPIATLSPQGHSFDQNLHALLDRKRRLMQEALLSPEATDSEKH